MRTMRVRCACHKHMLNDMIMRVKRGACNPVGSLRIIAGDVFATCQCMRGDFHDEIVTRIGPDVGLYADSYFIVMMLDGTVRAFENDRLMPIWDVIAQHDNVHA